MADPDPKSSTPEKEPPQGDDSKKKESRGSNLFRRLIINLLVIVIPVGAYWAFVLLRQQAYQIERGFRALGEIHRQADKKLEAVGDLFRIVPGNPDVELKAYQARLAPDLARASCLFADPDGWCRWPADLKVPGACSTPADGPVAHLPAGAHATTITVYPCHLLEAAKRAAEGKIDDPVPTGALVKFEVDPRTLFGDSKGLGEFERVIFGTPERILATLYPAVSRPELARSPQQPVEESDALRGLRYVIAKATGKLGDASGQAGLAVSTTVDVEIGGRDFTAFVNPVSFGMIRRSDLVLVGLRAHADIAEAATKPDNRLLFVILTLVVVLIVGWPILRMGLRPEAHPIGFYELWRVAGALTVIGAVAMLAAYSYVAQVRAANVAAAAARSTAQDIRDELRSGIRTRAELLRSEETFDRSHYRACPEESDADCTDGDSVCVMRLAEPVGPGRRDAAGVPLLEVFGRTEAKGRITGTVMTTTECRERPAVIDLSKREYFQLLQGERPPPLVAQRLVNWANGQKMLQLAIPFGSEGAIATGDTRLAALTFAPNPRRFEYAVFENATGTVLFHSDRRRALIENLFIETEHDASLLGAVAAGTGQFVRARYYGRSFQFYYVPLAGFGAAAGDADLDTLDWGIVVGFDRDELWSIGLMTWSNVMGVVLGFAALVWLAGFLLFRFRPTRHWLSRMIWPGGDYHPVLLPSASILVIVAGAVLLLLGGWVEQSTARQFVVTLIAVFAPTLAWVAGKRFAAGEGLVGGRRRTLWPYWVFLLFASTGVVPALLLTPPAWYFHETVFRANQVAAAMNEIAVAERTLGAELPGQGASVPDRRGELYRFSAAEPAAACSRPAHGVAATIWRKVPALRDLLPAYLLDGPESGQAGRFCFSSPEATESSAKGGFSVFDRHSGFRADVRLSAALDPPPDIAKGWATALVWVVTIGVFGFLSLSIILLLNDYRFILRNGGRPKRVIATRAQVLFVHEKLREPPPYLADRKLAEIDLRQPSSAAPAAPVVAIRGFDEAVLGADRPLRTKALTALVELFKGERCCVIVTAHERDAIDAFLTGADENTADLWRTLQRQLVTVTGLSEAILKRIQRRWKVVVAETRPLGDRAPDIVREFESTRSSRSRSLLELNHQELIEAIGQRLDAHYSRIWADLERHERLALFELAHGLLPGPRDAAVLRTLENKGLCTLDPFPHLESASFEGFVATVEPGLRDEERERDRRPSAWLSLRTPLLIVVVLGITWLAYSGGETVQIISAVLAATLGLATRVSQFAEFFRR